MWGSSPGCQWWYPAAHSSLLTGTSRLCPSGSGRRPATACAGTRSSAVSVSSSTATTPALICSGPMWAVTRVASCRTWAAVATSPESTTRKPVPMAWTSSWSTTSGRTASRRRPSHSEAPIAPDGGGGEASGREGAAGSRSRASRGSASCTAASRSSPVRRAASSSGRARVREIMASFACWYTPTAHRALPKPGPATLRAIGAIETNRCSKSAARPYPSACACPRMTASSSAVDRGSKTISRGNLFLRPGLRVRKPSISAL